MKQSKKQFFIVALTQIISAACQLLIIKLIAGELSTSEYGTLSLFLTFTILANQVCFVGTTSASGRFYIKSLNENFIEKFYSSLLVVFLVNCLVAIFLGTLLSFLFSIELIITIKMILIVLFEASYQIFNSISNAKDKRKLVLFHVSFYYLLRTLILILIIYFFNTQNFNFESAIDAFLISVLLTFTIQYLPKYRLIFSIIKIDFRKYYKNIFKYIFPFYIFGFITFLNQGVDKWFIKFFLDDSYVGIYTLFFQFGFSPIILIATSFTTYLAPIYYNLQENKDENKINDLKRNFFIFILIGTVIAVFLSYLFRDFLITIIGNDSYYEYSYLLPFFVLAGSIFSATQLLNLEFFTKMDTKGYAIMNLINAFILISLFSTGLYFFDLIGAVIALVISHFIAFIIIFFYTKNFIHEK